VATRKRVYDMVSAEKMFVSGYHFPFPGLGWVEKAGTGYRLIPAAWNPFSDLTTPRSNTMNELSRRGLLSSAAAAALAAALPASSFAAAPAAGKQAAGFYRYKSATSR